MYDGYLQVGGNEVINASRTYVLAQNAGCPVSWFRQLPCDGIADALDVTQASFGNLTNAPWFDGDDEKTSRFYGLYPISVIGDAESTRQADVTESVLDGGVVGQSRHGTRQIQVRGLLVGTGQDAVEYGLSWLDAALEADSCGMHGDDCGEVDLCYFAACPPSYDMDVYPSNAAYHLDADTRFRSLHRVACTSGPLIEQKFHKDDSWGYMVNFTMVAGTPWAFSITRPLALGASTTVVTDDIPHNLIAVPNASNLGTQFTSATNYSPNPSLEVDASTWSGLATLNSGTSPTSYFTSGRVNDIASSGSYSYRGRILGNGSTEVAASNANIQLTHVVPYTYTAGERVSITAWSAALILAGSAVSSITSLAATAIWQTAGGSTLRVDTVASTTSTSDFNGRVYALRSIAPPATTGQVLIQFTAVVTWRSSATPANNSDIRFYADAVGVTVP